MNFGSISHRSAFTDCYALNENEVVLNIRTGKDVTAVNLLHEDPYSFGISGNICWSGKRTAMKLHRQLKHNNVWSVVIRPEYKRLQYYFEIFAGDEKWLMLEDDFYTEETLAQQGRWKQFYKFPWLNSSDVMMVPSWVPDTVWYQIMPDRFCRSSTAKTRLFLKNWNDRSKVTGWDFYGGDLNGITQKLPYLKDLGINGIYLLPVFLSNSNHKYNTFDYDQIDPDFGTEADLKELISTAHSLGIRVMLDAVFNHSGTEFFAWKDVWEKGEKSPYFNWFCINEVPFKRHRGSLRDGRYYGFAFLDSMPKLNTNNPEVTAYFKKRCKYWIENWDIDGIRFDVGNEVSHSFLKAIRGDLKVIKPDVFLLGEIWHDSVQWLQGDEYDSVMNYPFFESMHNFWVDPNAASQDFMYAMNRVYSLYPEQINRGIFNFLDTHDTMRARNRCGTEDVLYQQLAILMTMPGSACVYYGTEIAMPGGHDPDCRRTMPWDEIGQGVYDHQILELKKLIALRNNNPQTRGTEILWYHSPAQPRLICYDRPGTAKTVRVYINGGNQDVNIQNASNILYQRHFAAGLLKAGGILVLEMKP